MMRFKMSTQLPATRDLNAVLCATWDRGTNCWNPRQQVYTPEF